MNVPWYLVEMHRWDTAGTEPDEHEEFSCPTLEDVGRITQEYLDELQRIYPRTFQSRHFEISRDEDDPEIVRWGWFHEFSTANALLVVTEMEEEEYPGIDHQICSSSLRRANW